MYRKIGLKMASKWPQNGLRIKLNSIPTVDHSGGKFIFDLFIHVSGKISKLVSCEIVGVTGSHVLFVCCYPGIQRGCQVVHFLFPMALYLFA